jgi:hypothetical protein
LKAPAIDRHNAMGALAYQRYLAASARGDKDVAASYLKAVEVANAAATRAESLQQTRDLATQQNQHQMEMMKEVGTQGFNLENARGTNTISVNQALADEDRKTASLSTGISDDEKPLVDYRTLPITEYAKTRRLLSQQQNLAGGVANPAADQAVEDNAYRTGFRVRAGQYVKESLENPMVPEFNASHPGMKEFQDYYRSLVRQRPGDYGKIRNEVTATIGGEVYRAIQQWSQKNGVPVDTREVANYMEQLVNGIAGPEPKGGVFGYTFSDDTGAN